MTRVIDVFKLGHMNYRECLHLQKCIVEDNLTKLSRDPSSPILNKLLLVEHSPVYTIGLRRQNYTGAQLEILKNFGAQVEVTDRGGLITFHGPGQLVAYPIFYLKNFNPSVKWYVKMLESVIIKMCQKHYKLNAHRMCQVGYTGVWCDDKKFAALGIHCKRFVTYHGMAVNCNVNMEWFKNIVPCGIEDKAVTSLSELVDRNITVDEVRPKLVEAFGQCFEADLVIERTESETKNLIKDYVL